MNANEEAAAVLSKYEAALNASDTDAVMTLYAEDSVYMPAYSQSAVGAAAVRKAYDALFKATTLSIKFHVAEFVEVGSGWVFARSNSAETMTEHATGTKSAVENQELFIFKKDVDEKWKIARYSFSSTNPLPK